MKKIKIGLVGVGRAGWGMHTLELDTRSDKFEIVASCDIIPERNEKMKEKYGCRTYGSIEELVLDPEVEIVDIATRTCDHYKHALIALNAGKDVILDKPMTMTYDEAYDLFRRANKPGLPKLYIRQQRRFEAKFNAVLEAVNSGKLGNVYLINIEQNTFQHRDDWQTIKKFGGGQLLNWGPHIIDHSLQLLGEPAREIKSELKQVCAGGDCEDRVDISFIGASGRTVNMCISGASALREGRFFTAYGTRGALDVAGRKMTLRYIDPEQIVPEPVSSPETPKGDFGASGTFESGFKLNWITEEIEIGKDDLFVFWDYIYDSYVSGADFPIKDEEVLEIMKTITTVKEQNPVIKKI